MGLSELRRSRRAFEAIRRLAVESPTSSTARTADAANAAGSRGRAVWSPWPSAGRSDEFLSRNSTCRCSAPWIDWRKQLWAVGGVEICRLEFDDRSGRDHRRAGRSVLPQDDPKGAHLTAFVAADTGGSRVVPDVAARHDR
jgi:hypothetical protein